MHWQELTTAAVLILLLGVVAFGQVPGAPPRASAAAPGAPPGPDDHLAERRVTQVHRRAAPLLQRSDWVASGLAGGGAIEASLMGSPTSIGWIVALRQGRPPALPSRELIGALAASAIRHARQTIGETLDELAPIAAASPFPDARGTLRPPVPGELVASFGLEPAQDSPTDIRHPGLTYRVRQRLPVEVVAPGIVRFAGALEGYGGVVIVEHGWGYHSVYADLDGVSVHPGDVLGARRTIGEVGEDASPSGRPFHFELRHLGDALDPAPWLLSAP